MEIIRPGEKHIGQIYEIEKNSFTDPWSEKSFLLSLKNKDYLFLAAVSGETVCGYILGSVNGDFGYIDNIAVSSDFRRQGVGEMLLKEFIGYAEDSPYCSGVSLEVRQSNYPAISLYSKTGFKAAGKRARFYTDPDEDAVVMIKMLEVK